MSRWSASGLPGIELCSVTGVGYRDGQRVAAADEWQVSERTRQETRKRQVSRRRAAGFADQEELYVQEDVVCDGADLLSENETARLVRLGLRVWLARHSSFLSFAPGGRTRRPNIVPRPRPDDEPQRTQRGT
jgi:hypothetical protein